MTLPGALQNSGYRSFRALVLSTLVLLATPATGQGAHEAGPVEAIQVSDWRRAISNLNVALVAEPANADLQNWLGYAYRHEGRYDEAFDHFLAALQLDPLHRGAHLYIGETFLLTGDKAKAREHLGALLRICGTQCDEYRDLHQAIAAAK